MQAVRQILHPKNKKITIQIPDSFIDHDIEILAFPLQREKQKYDFSTLTGKLQWSGDPVKEQRKLRDEW